jgi:hypothetical protein
MGTIRKTKLLLRLLQSRKNEEDDTEISSVSSSESGTDVFEGETLTLPKLLPALKGAKNPSDFP